MDTYNEVNLRKLTTEELKEILKSHELWLNDKKAGKRANLSKCDLAEFNLEQVNLEKANLEASDLRRVNLYGANLIQSNLRKALLSNADLQATELIEADLRHAKLDEADLLASDLRRADLRYADFTKANLEQADLQKAIYFQSNIDYARNLELAKVDDGNIRLQLAEQKLEQLNLELEDEKDKNNQDSANVRHLKDEIIQQENEVRRCREERLKDRIIKSKISLDVIVRTTQDRISKNEKSAEIASRYAFLSFMLLIIFIIFVPIVLHYVEPSLSIRQMGSFIILLYTLPVISSLLIATTLLRHHKKLQDEIRHFSDKLYRIESYSGLLEASQHAASGFDNREYQSEKFVQETFEKIRDRLLADELLSQSSGNAIIDEQYHVDKAYEVLGKAIEIQINGKKEMVSAKE